MLDSSIALAEAINVDPQSLIILSLVLLYFILTILLMLLFYQIYVFLNDMYNLIYQKLKGKSKK